MHRFGLESREGRSVGARVGQQLGGNMQSDRSIRGYRRTAATGLLVALLVLAGLPAPGSPAGAAEAVEAERAAFTNGTAKATALITRVAPGVGSLELAISQGIAVSQLQNNLTQAQAQTLDLGLIGTTLTAESCG